jgi:hypothetical protein
MDMYSMYLETIIDMVFHVVETDHFGGAGAVMRGSDSDP